KITTVIGFPFGYDSIDFKKYQLEKSIFYGCDEFDIVFNIGKFIDKDYNYIYNELKSLINLTYNKITKIIIETCYLTKQQILDATQLVIDSGANFVKTSTGFGHSGAKEEDILLIKNKFHDRIMIKASGGIKDLNIAVKMLEAGADRLGISDVSFLIN
ncbi:MAG: deoxyribose-phosphate aldolase, partial [Calditerrivibrio sp.]|nr:deoxyribose-phosphate aldolase [Calditerrivibrio sp.]